MGWGSCNHECSKTKTYEEKGRGQVGPKITKVITTKCGCKEYSKGQYEGVGDGNCDTCGHRYHKHTN